MLKYYAGIGSRETSNEILEYFSKLGTFFTKKGYTLRSGHAQGADKAFEIGNDKANGLKEIYLPWKNFEGSNSNLFTTNPKAIVIAKQFHPYWAKLSDGARSLQSRNSHQVLGLDLETPSEFIICWTKGGQLPATLKGSGL